MMKAITLSHEDRVYEVAKLVGEDSHGRYRLYRCRVPGVDREYLLQIASEFKHNGSLDKAAFFLRELKRVADELEAEYNRLEPGKMLNYHLSFPELVDSFVCEEQGNRRVNVLAFRNVDVIKRLVPIANIVEIDALRCDLRSSAWVMGKLLKILVLTQSMKVVINQVNGANTLLDADQHYVVIFDWADSEIQSGEILAAVARREIGNAAFTVIDLLGGDYKTRTFPEDESESAAYAEYTAFLLGMADGHHKDAAKAHRDFYAVVDKYWSREFYPFTTHPRSR
ncbi:TPA: hypothetical protein DF272_02865 [Candidatus Falkowbacteria bacterium]|nr:hypothetical protein [Candidatus Falkowbacteria bacterium]